MAASSAMQGAHTSIGQSDETLNTTHDPRPHFTPSDALRSQSVSPAHPELSNEVATLSNKLIHAINHQTDLDDTLSDTRHQLEAAQERIRQLEKSEQEHTSMVENRILVKWVDVEEDTLRLRMNLAEERRQLAQTENDKRAMEQELESLTTALFEEANQMVATVRKEARRTRDALERRNEQLQAQLKDAETLLASHQEQLVELKQAMSDISSHRSDLEAITTHSTTPSTPTRDGQDHMRQLFDALNIVPTTAGGDEVAPAPPTHFSHLISPSLKNDVPAFEDFHALMDVGRRSGPPSRVASGNYSNFTGLGLSNLGKNDLSHLNGRLPSNGSTSSLSASNTYQSPSSTPNLPASNNTSISSREISMSGTPLKETAFYKRVMLEDIEPTLRLDAAPGLSWLARRSVISSMCEGKLIVEPTPPQVRLYYSPCSLCGENSRRETKARTHRFRTNESENAQRYPLCEYCLNRVRSTCDFLGFLRMIKDGHWRTEGQHAENMAWEESVRLRERMFWSRIGGGVVPAFVRSKMESARTSAEDAKPPALTTDPDPDLPHEMTRQLQSSPLKHAGVLGMLSPYAHGAVQSQVPGRPKIDAPGSRAADMKEGEKLDDAVASPPFHRPTAPVAHEDRHGQGSIQRPQMLDKRSSLQRTTTRSRGSSRTEGDGAANLVAKRAALFEKSASDEIPSGRLQHSLQGSVGDRSPAGL